MLNEAQYAVVNSVADKLLCLAGAGTGKTYTLIARIQRLIHDGVDPRSILVLTFTNAAAFEMEQRFMKDKLHPIYVPKFATFHSFCYGLLASDPEILNLIGYTQVPEVATDIQVKEINSLAAQQCNIKTSEKSDPEKYKTLRKAVKRILKQRNLITFNNMCYDVCQLFVNNLPPVWKYKDRYKYVMIDEFQDTDDKQYKFMMSFTRSNLFVVGDALQCQPAGTQVTLSDWTTKPIEDIKVGDYVVTYNRREGRYIQNLQFRSGDVSRYAKQVTGVACRYADNIVKVSSAYHSSSYTKDHITYAKIHYEGNETKYVVYLMRNSYGWWRVGSTSLFLSSQGNDFGPRSRLKAEHGDAVWILDVVPDRLSAWMNEQMVAYKYGIPQSTWEHGNVRYTHSDLAKMYEMLGDLTNNAKRCLSAYDRDIEYPFWTVGDLNRHFSKLHLFPIRVGNLITGVMDIVVPELANTTPSNPGRKYRNTYEQILNIEPVAPQLVYSLEVADYHNYVADGILTHNCLYTFRGADSSIIKSLASDPAWEVHKLTENYRSTEEICNFANNMSGYADETYRVTIQGHGHGDSVQVITPGWDWKNYLSDIIQPDKETAVLCRTNAEVAKVCDYLRENNIAFTTSRSPQEVINLCNSVLDDKYKLDWVASLLPAGMYEAYIRESTLDREYTFDKFYENFKSVYSVKHAVETVDAIKKLFENPSISICADLSELLQTDVPCIMPEDTIETHLHKVIDNLSVTEDNSPVYVGTVHSVKGLEFDRVIVLNVNSYSFKLNNEDNWNIYYVAITRAKTHLTIFKTEDKHE